MSKRTILGAGSFLLTILISMMLYVLAQENKAPSGTDQINSKEFRISGPYKHDNLSVFLIHGQSSSSKVPLTLQEAMEQNKVVVHETGEVNELAIENKSKDEEVYVQAGDIVKGGKQDRVLTMDLLLPPNSGKIPIASFCVEQGRWSKRGSEEATRFNASTAQISSKELKLAVRHKNEQGEVWKNVSKAQDGLSSNVGGSVQSSSSASSLQLTLENSKVNEMVDKYTSTLSSIIDGKSDVIGYAFTINGKANSADVYSSTALFRKLWPKLLKASAVEAVEKLNKGKEFPESKIEDVQAILDDANQGTKSEKEVSKRIKMITRETGKSLLFETKDQDSKDAWIHRSYVTKD
jgi:hypothetical protein